MPKAYNISLGNLDIPVIKGDAGDVGNSISSIKKTSTEDLVDTYTITYTNGSTTTFQVTNGKDGASGSSGDYNELENKPQIEGVTLENNKSFEELGLETLTNLEIESLINSQA